MQRDWQRARIISSKLDLTFSVNFVFIQRGNFFHTIMYARYIHQLFQPQQNFLYTISNVLCNMIDCCCCYRWKWNDSISWDFSFGFKWVVLFSKQYFASSLEVGYVLLWDTLFLLGERNISRCILCVRPKFQNFSIWGHLTSTGHLDENWNNLISKFPTNNSLKFYRYSAILQFRFL